MVTQPLLIESEVEFSKNFQTGFELFIFNFASSSSEIFVFEFKFEFGEKERVQARVRRQRASSSSNLQTRCLQIISQIVQVFKLKETEYKDKNCFQRVL